MSDTPKKPGPAPQFKAYPALLTPDQIKELRSAGPRNGNGYLRDLIDFGIAHRPLFFAWVTARGNIATNEKDASA